MDTEQDRTRSGSLWRHADFLKLWTGETMTLFGIQITNLAIPLAAAMILQATPAQMGMLNSAQFLPSLLVTLFAGVWVDRRRRRPVMIGTNLGRALLLALLSLGFWLGIMRMEYLYAVAFALGVFTLLFDLSYQSYLPSLLSRDQLIEGNIKLQSTAAFVNVSGNGLAGLLIGWVTAPIALLVDVLGNLCSAASLLAIRKREPQPVPQTAERAGVWTEMSTGLRFILQNRYLRAFTLESGTYNLFYQILWAVLVLYMTRDLQISAGVIGLILATTSVGALLGASIAGPLGQRFGQGPTVVLAMVLGCCAPLLIPFAAGPTPVATAVLGLSFFISGVGALLSNVHFATIRQTVTPPQMLGRAIASLRFVCTGAAALGALLGGALGTVIGLRPTLFIGAIGCAAALYWIFVSPLPTLRHISELVEKEQGE